MKKLLTILMMIAAVMIVAPEASAQKKMTRTQLYEQAKSDYQKRNFEAAKQKAAILLKSDRGNPYYRRLYNASVSRLKNGNQVNSMEGALKQLIIKEVEFDSVDLDTFFLYVNQKAAELSGGKVRPNIVYRGTEEQRNEPNITIKLSNIPLSELIRYVGQQSRTKFSYEKYAISGIPLDQLIREEAPKSNDPFA